MYILYWMNCRFPAPSCSTPCLWKDSLQGHRANQCGHWCPGWRLQQAFRACGQRRTGWSQWAVPKLQMGSDSFMIVHAWGEHEKNIGKIVQNCLMFIRWSSQADAMMKSSTFLCLSDTCSTMCHVTLVYAHAYQSIARCTKVAQNEAKIRSGPQEDCPAVLQYVSIGPKGPRSS